MNPQPIEYINRLRSRCSSAIRFPVCPCSSTQTGAVKPPATRILAYGAGLGVSGYERRRECTPPPIELTRAHLSRKKIMASVVTNGRQIQAFNFAEGEILLDKYEVVSQLGKGWESEVYHLRELGTGIDRAGKFFYPHRDTRGRTSIFHARKLHKLRNCPILIQYHTKETIYIDDTGVTMLVSEFVEGEPLSRFLHRQSGRRLTPFEGLHLLHTLARGVEPIHNHGEYHGDLHLDNILVLRRGIGFELKVIDFFRWWGGKAANMQEDVLDIVRIFYDTIGGQPRYAKQPEPVKRICCGLKRSLILNKFRTAGQLRVFLEQLEWE